MKRINSGFFDYKGYFDQTARCWFDYIETDIFGTNIVVFTELENNFGPSITNVSELVATSFILQESKKYFAIKTTTISDFLNNFTIIFAERYEYKPKEFDWISFTLDGNKLINPIWKPASKEEAELLLQYCTLP